MSASSRSRARPEIIYIKQPIVHEQVSKDKAKALSFGSASLYPGIPPEMYSYVQAVQQKIAHSISYPSTALGYNWEGTVKLGLIILKDGTLALAMVKESSGFEKERRHP